MSKWAPCLIWLRGLGETSMSVIAITGANRGIGLALAKRYAEQGDRVIAICRHSSAELDEVVGVEVIGGIDVTCAEALRKLSDQLSQQRIDVLINNAGLLIGTQFDSIEDELDIYRQQFEINTLAPIRVTRALIHCLSAGSRVIIVTSRMGSMADNTSGGQFAYRISKAGVNSAGVSLAHELKPKGIALALLHPGYVRTGITKGNGEIEPDEAARGLMARISELNLENTGGFRHANGMALPW